MIFFVVLARRVFIFMLLFLGPLCFLQHIHSGFPEVCEHTNAEVDTSWAPWIIAQKTPHKKPARVTALPHVFTLTVSLLRLYPVLGALTRTNHSPQPPASRCLPMLC
jgi:hypothetical protein